MNQTYPKLPGTLFHFVFTEAHKESSPQRLVPVFLVFNVAFQCNQRKALGNALCDLHMHLLV